MSDIYDYAYAHVLHRPEEVKSSNAISLRPDEVNSYATAVEDTNTESKVNTAYLSTLDLQTFIDSLEAIVRLQSAKLNAKQNPQDIYSYAQNLEDSSFESAVNSADFSPQDLQMFVDSLEAIARLEQAKISDNPQRKVLKSTRAPKRIQVTCLDASTCESLHDDDDSSFSNLSCSSAPEYLYDETYFGVPNCIQSTDMYTSLMSNTVPSYISDSEESGVFVNNTCEGHLYENLQPLKTKSKIVCYSKIKSLKSRLISLFLKTHCVKSQKPSGQILSSTRIGEKYDANETYESIFVDVTKQELKSKKSQKIKKKPSGNKSKENIISKAIRKLTL